MRRKLHVNSNPSSRRLARENREKGEGDSLIYHLFTNEKMQKQRGYNRKRHENEKPKKGIDKVGGDEYNSQCCREGGERERAASGTTERSLKTI